MKINLLPQEFRPQPLVSPVRLGIIIGGMVLILVALAGVVWQYLVLRNEERMIANYTVQLEIRKAALAEANDIEARLNKLKQRQAAINKIIETYPEYPVLLKTLVGALRNDVWLTSVEATTDGFFKIRGETLFFNFIGDFLKGLSQSETYQSARLINVDEVDNDGVTTYSFQIDIETGEGAPKYAAENR